MQSLFDRNNIIRFIIVSIVLLITAFLILNPSEKVFLISIAFFCVPAISITIIFLIKRFHNLIGELQFVHVMWILLLIGLLMFSGRTSQDIILNPVQNQKWLRIIPTLFAGCLTSMYVLKESQFSILFRGPLLFYFFYCISSLVSVTYSSYLGYSAWKAVELMIGFIAIAAIISSHEKRINICTVNTINFTWNNILIITVILGAIIFPTSAFYKVYGDVLPQLHGVYPLINSNSLGLMSAIAILYLFSKIIDSKFERLPLLLSIVVFSIVFIFAQSRTSMIGLSLSLLGYLFLKKKIKLLISVALIAILLAIISSNILSDLFASYVLRGRGIQSASIVTLSGRTEGWHVAVEKFSESPIWGYGIASGARYDVMGKVPGRENQGTLHNAFLDVLINNGIMGFVPWIVSYLWTLFILAKRSLSFRDDKLAPLLTSILILFGVRMITGDSLVYHDDSTLMFLGILAYAQLLQLKRLNMIDIAM